MQTSGAIMDRMVARPLDAEIDRLYQLAPDAFTAARNALAKTAGAEGAAVKALARPALAAWAVNQLYWRQRDAYDALVHAAGEVRQAHQAVLAGRNGDVRATGKVHEAAVDRALKATLWLLEADGQKATDATRHAVATTLRALPAGEPAGRLTTPLQPGGFEMLAGLSISAGSPAIASPAPARPEPPAPKRTAANRPAAPVGGGRAAARAEPAPPSKTPSPREKAAMAKAEARDREREERTRAAARAAAAESARVLRKAEHDAQREEFEAARAAREADKADARLKQAREALEDAQRDVEAASTAAAAAARAKDRSEARSAAAARALEAARASVSRP